MHGILLLGKGMRAVALVLAEQEWAENAKATWRAVHGHSHVYVNKPEYNASMSLSRRLVGVRKG